MAAMVRLSNTHDSSHQLNHHLKFVYIDINECYTGTDLCEYNCTNTIGSYACSCDIGFQLNEDGLQCDGQSKLAII